jgi:stage II sporulation protein D
MSFRPFSFSLSLALALFLSLSTASADSTVRISILSILRPKEVSITLISPERTALQTKAGQKIIVSGQTITIRQQNRMLSAGQGMSATAMRYCPDTSCTFRIEVGEQLKRNYEGGITLTAGNYAIDIVLQISQELFLASMTTSEMGESRDMEALKAFAIVARSFLLAGPRHPSIHADLCDTTHCEVFQAFRPTAEGWKAVQETTGLILTYKNVPFRPYYSRSCGGRTATYREVWGKDSPDYPFQPVVCPCRNEWQANISFEQLQLAFGFPVVHIKQLEKRIELSGGNRKLSVSGEEFRTQIGRTSGWDLIKSNWFVTTTVTNGLLIRGKGLGHRVGFCQEGAVLLAAQRKTFLQILQYYFPNTEIRANSNS